MATYRFNKGTGRKPSYCTVYETVTVYHPNGTPCLHPNGNPVTTGKYAEAKIKKDNTLSSGYDIPGIKEAIQKWIEAGKPERFEIEL